MTVETLGGLVVDTTPDACRACSVDRWPRAVKEAQAGHREHLVAGVVRPTSASEVARVLADADRRGISVLPVGLGSSVVGGLRATEGQLAICLRGLDRIWEVDQRSLTVRVGAGVRGSDLEVALNRRGLTVGHYPQSLPISSVGGWIATRASGITSTRHGSIEHRLAGVEVALADGTVVSTPAWPRASVGPDLAQLFVGSEGTLGVVCSAVLRVRRASPVPLFEAYAFPCFEVGLEPVRELMQQGVVPAIARLYNADEAARFHDDPAGALLLLAHAGHPRLAALERDVAAELCVGAGGRPLSQAVAQRWWEHRYDASRLFDYAQRPGGVADAIDVCADWSVVPRLARRLDATLRPLVSTFHLHASHFYEDGASLYAIVFLDADGPREAIDLYDRVWCAALEACLEEGAAISHHHGVGVLRLAALEGALGSSAQLLSRVKQAFDPNAILSPGRLAAA